MYSKRPGLILAFHGCDKTVRNNVVCKKGVVLKPSTNVYDWLGNGVYFWENNSARALAFAEFLKDNPAHNSKQNIETSSVIGAIIDLGHCLDLLDSEYLNLLKGSYKLLEEASKKYGLNIPKNVPLVKNGDLIKRNLDCAVIESIHAFNKKEKLDEFDSVRGVFFEGKELFPNAGFKEKNHIQIAIRNPNCIKGYFIPRELDSAYRKP